MTATATSPRPIEALDAAVAAAVGVLARTQTATGSWKGDYSGPLFLPPMLVGTHHVVGAPLPPDVARGLERYLRHTRNPDGAWGVGIENPSCVFTTVLNVVALRLLGVPADDPDVVRARDWAAARGGPLACASWGRFFLAVLGLYDWSGIDPVPPETWLLPWKAPVHPGRMWCHARMVYLPMSWLYGRRATGPIDATIRALRTELYPQGYDTVNWKAARSHVAPEDAATPRTRWLRAAHAGLRAVETVLPRRVREHALSEVLDQVAYEDEITAYRCIGPVNKLYDTLVWHFQDPGGPRVRRHLEVLPLYLSTDDQGTRMNGYDSSELWDTAFAAQALLATGDAQALPTLRAAHAYVDATQVRSDPPARRRHYRARSLGAWPFSTQAHGWPITDCTAEGLLAALGAAPWVDTPIDGERLAQAVDRLLAWQNADGSWASYERTRGPGWLEALNPSDIFGRIMIDHGHTECTGAAMTALAAWRRAVPGAHDSAVTGALRAGSRFLKATQRPDGGWLGGWAVCFTYGTWFAVRGLRAAGTPADDPAVQRAVRFLDDLALPDGGWGEHVDACRLQRPVPTERAQPVQTAWALLALQEAGATDHPAYRRGLAWLLAAQRADGTFVQEHVTGVFNGTCSIHYDAYPAVFPLWALARARAEVRG
ncbi:MAG: terpene cyclase/mutase family protein [Alphaproteobacteria bacterium]|nr:terpene cyclase/mutase family protein [Alphaproteobacteria bacterium]